MRRLFLITNYDNCFCVKIVVRIGCTITLNVQKIELFTCGMLMSVKVWIPVNKKRRERWLCIVRLTFNYVSCHCAAPTAATGASGANADHPTTENRLNAEH